jgi:hypothetical protein
MSTIHTDIASCARCSKDHSNLIFKSLLNPIKLRHDIVLTHWCSCPDNKEPIMLAIVDYKSDPGENI